MNREIYKKLAEKLDDLPNQYPATESGVELRLLEKIFTPEEAELAGEMVFVKETASIIASRANLPEKQARRTLKNMVRKGLIRFSKGDRELLFGLMPFVIGFYEELLPRLDQEMAELFEQYFQESGGEITGKGLSVHRVIPVEESIDFEMEIFPYEKASDLLEKAKSWGVRDCICRLQKQLIGDPCDHPLENCLVFAPIEGAFNKSEVDRTITKEEALKILHEAEEAGLVHTTGNYQGPNYYICNCCTCSCGILRGVVEFNKPSAITKSDFLVVIDEDLCVGCGDCIERCQFTALVLEDLICRVDLGSCVGCGLCVPVCQDEAMVLIRRPEGEMLPPPENIRTWGEVRFEG